MALGAHHIGAVALLEVGSEVYSRTRRLGDGEDEASSTRIGGLVITSLSERSEDDPGQVRTVYQVLDPYRTRPQLHFYRIADEDIDPETIGPPSTSRMGTLVRRLCEEVAFSGPSKRRKGPVTPQEADLLSAASRLIGAIFVRQ